MSVGNLAVGQVGPSYNADGTQPVIRLGRRAEQIASEYNPRFYEVTYRGGLFMLDSGSVTIAAANASGQAMGTAKLINGFWNPANSGKNAILVAANIATVSGTPGGPILYEATAAVVAITSAVTGTVRSGLLGSSGSQMKAMVNVALVAQDANTAALVQVGVSGGPAAIAGGAGIYSNFDAIDGKIIVPPGFVFGLCSTATGTSHVVQSTLFWVEEII